MATLDDGDAVRRNDSILAWYDSTRPMQIDLVGDYAGKELFLIEGDSMLRECFSDDRIDFKDGFQMLHAVYVVEKFLENLLKRHCRFHIGFFAENEKLCIPPHSSAASRNRYLLARAVIKRHLSLRLPESNPDIQIHTFPTLESNEFEEYLNLNPIHFVMAHDGSIVGVNTIDNDDTTPKQDMSCRIVLRGMIWYFNTNKLNVALINRIEFRDSKVFTMIVESIRKSRKEMSLTGNFANETKENRILLRDNQSSGEWTADSVSGNVEKLIHSSSNQEFGEGYLLAAHVILEIVKEGEFDILLPSAFILHIILLRHIPISTRRLPLVTFDEEFEEKLSFFFSKVSEISQATIESKKWSENVAKGSENETIDFIDGRLFRVLLRAMCDGSVKNTIPQPVQNDWDLLCSIISKLTEKSLSLEGSTGPTSSQASAVNSDFETIDDKHAVLPFSSSVFDKHLECIHVSTDTSIQTRLGSLKLYRETTHWHNHRKPLDTKLAPAPKVSKWKNPLRLNQFYMAEMTKYAASLTGSTGKALDPETITVGPRQLIKVVESAEPGKATSKSKKENGVDSKSKEKPVDKKGDAKKGTKKAAAGLSKKEQMIADNKERKGGNEADKAFNAWAMIMKDLNGTTDDQDRYLKTVEYLNSLDSAKTAYLEGDIATFMLQSLLNWWATYCKAQTKSEGYHAAALIWTTIRSICTTKSPLSKDVVVVVTQIATLLEITDALDSLTATTDRKLSFTFKYPPQSNILGINMSQQEFQLVHCGPYMDRMLDAKPDPRVSNFIPDGWQRNVLDQLDANRSIFVVAPTSSGKTFISFYAMESMLRADNDGVLVYVAPTKALVNQIAAEIQARFSKRFPVAGKGVWAIHTRDYRVNNSTGCQILVTVPHILQIMLLSPSNAKSWGPRVRRIIFDEIHSIGQAEDGVVWEQLLLLAPCPIIALSATVGNPEQFSDWLAETQKSSGSELRMIQHDTRYSDLRKYMFKAPKSFTFNGLGASYGVGLGLDSLTGFTPFHPISSLVDKTRGMPDDLGLEPRDCFTLWKAMNNHQNTSYPVPDSLDPKRALPLCIRKADIFAWEKQLKQLLRQWMKDRDSPFDNVIESLTPSASVDIDDEHSSTSYSITEGDKIDPWDLKETTLPLLFQLHKRRALPAILFNYDRNGCEEIADTILKQLVDAEDKWKQGSQWKKLMAGYEKYLETKDKKSRKPVKPIKKSKDDDEGGSKTDRMRDESSDGASIYDLFDPLAPQPDFSFANPKNLQKAELEIFIRQLERKGVRNNLIELLKRGIGVHHAGMNRKYRQCVEMLFRKKFLRVVIATGTLSLGINMPCATVVFSGDSVFLTALNFRQAAGRSGRRGFDLLGNVVFQCIPRERASRLLSSRLPELTGHFPITTTLVLRLFTLLNDSKNSPYAIKAINSLLSQPRLYLGGESFKAAVLHHLRFSIEYLRRNELLGPGGEPVNFTSCVSHLYYTENSTFAFHALLKDGYFSNLCADIDTKTDLVLHEMMLTLCHIFGRRVCRVLDDEDEAENIKRSPSIVYLPDMPEMAVKILRKHNKDTLDIFTSYVKTFAAQHVKEEERYLPLTRTVVGDHQSLNANGIINGNETSQNAEAKFPFIPSLPAPKARSVFAALSGLGDKFTTIEDLSSSAKEGVFLEAAVIPHLQLHPDETKTPLNAYLLDFYMHGALAPLEKANGIRKSDVWFVLNDFSMILATIVTSLAVYLGLAPSNDTEMLDMGAGEEVENEDDEKDAADEEVASTTSNSTKASTTSQPLFIKKSKKVVDDWDAGEDALAAEDEFIKSENTNGVTVTDDEEYDRLMNVYRAFRKLKNEFDAKFKAIWA